MKLLILCLLSCAPAFSQVPVDPNIWISTQPESYSDLGKPQPLHITIAGYGELCPADDITPKEAVLIAMMLAAANGNADLKAFVKEHHLERHFREPSCVK